MKNMNKEHHIFAYYACYSRHIFAIHDKLLKRIFEFDNIQKTEKDTIPIYHQMRDCTMR
jgi:hypothetical protein